MNCPIFTTVMWRLLGSGERKPVVLAVLWERGRAVTQRTGLQPGRAYARQGRAADPQEVSWRGKGRAALMERCSCGAIAEEARRRHAILPHAKCQAVRLSPVSTAARRASLGLCLERWDGALSLGLSHRRGETWFLSPKMEPCYYGSYTGEPKWLCRALR